MEKKDKKGGKKIKSSYFHLGDMEESNKLYFIKWHILFPPALFILVVFCSYDFGRWRIKKKTSTTFALLFSTTSLLKEINNSEKLTETNRFELL